MRSVQPWHQTPWDWRATIQFICGGTGTGLLFFTALAALQEADWLVRTGTLVIAFVGTGLIFVWIKLGRRWRALLVFLNPRTSWMTREAILSIPLVILVLAAIASRAPVIGLLAAVSGLGFLYAQARILRESMGIPAWREPLIVPLIVFTGLAEGAALMLIATVFFGAVGVWLPTALLLLLTIRLWLWSAYQRKLSAPGAAPLRTVAALDRANRTVIMLGHVIPLLMLISTIFIPSAAVILGLLAGLGGLFGGWYLKFTLLNRAAYNQGFAIARTPARSPGYSGPGAKPGWR